MVCDFQARDWWIENPSEEGDSAVPASVREVSVLVEAVLWGVSV
jgi:hypothetical protein